MAAVTEADRLRLLLGEVIPVGGADTDTLFSDDVINDLLARNGEPENCQLQGWMYKAAALANLVTTVEGSSQRKLSDLHDHAIAQVKLFGGSNANGVRIGTIVRSVRGSNYT